MKRLLMSAAMFLCCVATTFAQFSGSGSGTESDPYLISNPIHLNQIRNFMNTKVYFKLTNDIDLTEFLEEENPSQGWLPIGDYISNSFKGVLDGNGKTIRGLWIKRASTDCVGFFSCMEDATIKNLTIEAANIECSSGGIIAGTGAGNITITGCSVSGTVKGKGNLGGYVGELSYKASEHNNNSYSSDRVLSNNIAKVNILGTGKCVGGFAGVVSAKLIISDCIFYDSAVCGTEFVGGLFGKAAGKFTGHGIVINLTHCGFIGEITGTTNVGGLIGYIKHDQKLDFEDSYIKKCFARSNIDATGDNVGGLVGYDWGYNTDYDISARTYIDNNYHSGSVKGANYVGGIVGYKLGAEVTSCLATGSVVGSDYVGGIIGRGEQNKILRNVAIDTEITATANNANRIGSSSGIIGSPGTTDENKAYNKVIVTRQGVVQDIVDNKTNGAGVGVYTLKQKATYVAMGFDFNNVWEISDGEGYPYIVGSTQIWPCDKKDVSSLTINPITDVTYNGSAQTPAVTVIDGTITLTNGTDYTVSYSNNISVGTATVTITGKGNYTGTKTVTFTIYGRSVSNFTISSIANVTYSGLAQTPTVIVKDGTTTLINGTHYTISYINNTNAGTATVNVNGKGNYSGTRGIPFTIEKASLTVTAKSYTIKQGEPFPIFDAYYSGFKNGETSSVLTTQPTFNCSASSTSIPGEFDIIVSGITANNYSVNYIKGKLTISPSSGDDPNPSDNPDPDDPEPASDPDTDISSMNNVIYMNKVEASADSQINLSIRMKNTAAIRGFQFDIYLPEGVTVVKSAKGKIIGSLSDGRLPEDDEHSLTLSEQGDGAIRFLCGSLYDETFTGNDGEIATLTVKIAENINDGDHAVILRNIKLTETDINKYYQTEYVKSTLTIQSYTLGDINDDGKIDVSDYIGIANHILGNAQEGFNVKAADVNQDGNIDVSDYIGVANIILTGSIYGTTNNARIFLFEEDVEQEMDPQ